MTSLLTIVMMLMVIALARWSWDGYVELIQELWGKCRPPEQYPYALPAILAVVFALATIVVYNVSQKPLLLLAAPGALLVLGVIGNLTSAHRSAEWRAVYEEQQRIRKNNAKDLYARYEADPYLLQDSAFLKEFIDSGAIPDIKNRGARFWICAGCGKTIYQSRHAHVDHIKPKSKYPHLRYLISNLQILCSRCNMHKGAYDGDDWKEEIVRRKRAKAAARRRATIKARNG